MTKRFIALLSVISALLPVSAEPTLPPNGFDVERAEIQTFIDEVAARHSLDTDDLRKLIAKAEPQPKIIELMSKPAERVLAW